MIEFPGKIKTVLHKKGVPHGAPFFVSLNKNSFIRSRKPGPQCLVSLLLEFVRVTCRKVKFFIPPAHQPIPASVSAQNCI